MRVSALDAMPDHGWQVPGTDLPLKGRSTDYNEF